MFLFLFLIIWVRFLSGEAFNKYYEELQKIGLLVGKIKGNLEQEAKEAC